uniref:Secreted protein n=1 Tax=Strongyloides stercoralis TaxID=6248 RepID=A0A0K0DYY4_STRER
MHLLNTWIFVFAITLFATGYKVHCPKEGGCIIYMKPYEPEYYNTFLDLLEPKVLELGFTVDDYKDMYDCNRVNKLIKENVKQSYLMKFARKLKTFEPRSPISLKLAPKLKGLLANTYNSNLTKEDNQLLIWKYLKNFKP